MRSINNGKERANVSANHGTKRRDDVMRRSLPCVLAASVLAIILAACGMASTPLPSPPPTRLPPTVSATPIVTPQPTPLPPVTPTSLPAPTPTLFPTANGGAACGLIEIRDGTIADPSATAKAEECFWQAYQTCDVSEDLDVVHTRTDTPSYWGGTYHLMKTGVQCTIEINGGAVPVVVDAKGTRTVGGAPIFDICTGMARDTLDDVLFTDCRLGRMWDLMAP